MAALQETVEGLERRVAALEQQLEATGECVTWLLLNNVF